MLAIPATEVYSETVFSHTGNVQTNRRHNLTVKSVRELTFLHMNADLHVLLQMRPHELKRPLQQARLEKRLKFE
jgi:hypothetical protein